MTKSDVVLVVIAFVLIFMAGVFAAVDAALTRVSRAQASELLKEGRRGAKALCDVIADLPRHTNLLLLLRTVGEITATVLASVVILRNFEINWGSVIAAAALMTVVSYVIVGVGPRTTGRQHPYRVALGAAGVVRTLGVIFGPIASLLILVGNAITPGKGFREGPFASEVELREMVDLAELRGVVEHGERQMIHSVFDLGDTIVREVMVPRPDVVWIEAVKTVPQALALALRSGFSRIPVVGENMDDVAGVVYLKDLVRRSQNGNAESARTTRVSEVMRQASFVPESKPVDDLLREMQSRRIHMAIVVDEHGGTAGLVTIEDILEEIVGEIADEYDTHERTPIEDLPDGSVRVQARVTIEDLAEHFDVDIDPEDDDVETVGGLLAERLGRVPIAGAEIEIAGLHLIAEGTAGRRNRIDSVLVTRILEPTEDTQTELDVSPTDTETEHARSHGAA